MTIVRPTGGPAAQGDDQFPSGSAHRAATNLDTTVPQQIREERIEAQIEIFQRAGYRVDQRSPMQAVMIREHRRDMRTRVASAVRTLGVVPVLMRAPKAYHRVVITVGTDGAISLI